jgi:hypothetical protein
VKGFEEEFMKVEKEGERVGWMKVCLVLLSIIPSIPLPHRLVLATHRLVLASQLWMRY